MPVGLDAAFSDPLPAAAFSRPPQCGDRLDRYELLCPLAEGGMATVWLARPTGKFGFEKLVAVKTILSAYAEDTAFRRMFLNEANLAARVEHPHVARIIDVG